MELHGPRSSLVEGDEGSYLSNCQTNLVIALHAPSLLFWHFINTTAYHLSLHLPFATAFLLNKTVTKILKNATYVLIICCSLDVKIFKKQKVQSNQ